MVTINISGFLDEYPSRSVPSFRNPSLYYEQTQVRHLSRFRVLAFGIHGGKSGLGGDFPDRRSSR